MSRRRHKHKQQQTIERAYGNPGGAMATIPANMCYNDLRNIVDRSDVATILRPELHLYERRANGYSIPKLSPLQALPYRLWREAMPAPKDPQKREEWLRKLRAKSIAWHESRRGTDEYEEWRRKVGEGGKGKHPNFTMKDKHHSSETIEKIRASQKGKARWTEEDKVNMSIERTGRRVSPEAIEKIRAKLKGKTWSDETQARRTASLNNPELLALRSARGKANFDVLTEEQQAAYVRKRLKASKSKNTRIELYIAHQLDQLGVIYEQQKHIGRYVVDFFIPEQNLIIEAMGCFWHYCKQCGYNGSGCEKRREHDNNRISFLESKGYMVALLWEHDLTPFIRAKDG